MARLYAFQRSKSTLIVFHLLFDLEVKKSIFMTQKHEIYQNRFYHDSVNSDFQSNRLNRVWFYYRFQVAGINKIIQTFFSINRHFFSFKPLEL